MNRTKEGYPKQLRYKIELVKLGLKSKDVAPEVGTNPTSFSQYINGKLLMPDNIKVKLDNYIKEHKSK
jgi:hypothetical protein